jgi:16S rRNA processing protein RimM
MSQSKRILLGEITTVHGIRGEVVVRSYAENPADITAYGTLETAQGKPVPALRVVRVMERGVVCRLDGIADRTAAERFRGTQLWIARDRLPPTDDGAFYHADLIGLTAVDGAGLTVGEVIAVENFGAGDLVEIRLAGGQRTEYVPFTDACVPAVDVAAGRLVVVMPVVTADDEIDRALAQAADGDLDGELEPPLSQGDH